MNKILDRLKTYGPWGALLPLLVTVSITLPKLYMELVGADLLGNREIIQAEVLSTWEHFDETCRAQLRMEEQIQISTIPCELRNSRTLEKIDAWTVYISPEDAQGHAIIDGILLLIEITSMLFLLRMKRFVEWVVKLSQDSAPIIVPQLKDKT